MFWKFSWIGHIRISIWNEEELKPGGGSIAINSREDGGGGHWSNQVMKAIAVAIVFQVEGRGSQSALGQFIILSPHIWQIIPEP